MFSVFDITFIKNLKVRLGLSKGPTGIKVEQSRNIFLDSNYVSGFTTGVDIKKSQDIKGKNNKILK